MNATSPYVPQRTTAEWQSLDAAHYLHPFTDHAALSRKGTRLITRAEGVYLYESEGRRILDGMSGLWCVNLGYGRDVAAGAVAAAMKSAGDGADSAKLIRLGLKELAR